jgi:hypothetical protein
MAVIVAAGSAAFLPLSPRAQTVTDGDGDLPYGGFTLSTQERKQLRDRLHSASDAERATIMEQERNRIRRRAQSQGKALPEDPTMCQGQGPNCPGQRKGGGQGGGRQGGGGQGGGGGGGRN